MKTTSIYIPTETWELLRAVAFRRAQASEAKASVSRVITEIVERHRDELRKETRKA